MTEARQRCDHVPDRYGRVAAHVGLADVQLSMLDGATATASAARLHQDAVHADLPNSKMRPRSTRPRATTSSNSHRRPKDWRAPPDPPKRAARQGRQYRAPALTCGTAS